MCMIYQQNMAIFRGYVRLAQGNGKKKRRKYIDRTPQQSPTPNVPNFPPT